MNRYIYIVIVKLLCIEIYYYLYVRLTLKNNVNKDEVIWLHNKV